MKKILLFIFIVSGLLLFFSLVKAASPSSSFDIYGQTKAFAGAGGANYTAPQDPRALAAKIINVALGVLGTLAVVYFIYGGYSILMSAGEEEKINTGKKTIITAVIGLAIIMSAYGISKLAFTVASGGDNQPPSSSSPIPPAQILDPSTVPPPQTCWWIFC